MCSVPARMHHQFGNSLVVEMEDFLAEMKVIDQQRPACADAQRVLVVVDWAALCGGQDRRFALGNLVQFAAIAAQHLLVVDLCGRCRGF